MAALQNYRLKHNEREKQRQRKRRAAAGRGDAVAVAALLEVRLKHNEYEKQYQRKRRDAARRGDASALAALQNYRLKANEYQRKRRDALRKHAVVDAELREAGKNGKQTKFRGMMALKEACKVAQSRLCQASPENAQEHSQIAEARRTHPKRKRRLQ